MFAGTQLALIIAAPDRDALAERLEHTLPDGTGGTWQAAGHDEIRGLFPEPAPAVDLALAALRSPGATVGIGASRNTDRAMGRARAALEQCSPTVPARGIAAQTAQAVATEAATALLRLMARGIRNRTDAEWRVVDLLVPDVRGQHRAVAQALGISPQAVSKALQRTGWAEERAGRAAVLHLLASTDRPGEPGGALRTDQEEAEAEAPSEADAEELSGPQAV